MNKPVIVIAVLIIAVAISFIFVSRPERPEEIDKERMASTPSISCDSFGIIVTANQNEYQENDAILITVENTGDKRVSYWSWPGWPTYPAGEKYDADKDVWIPTDDRLLVEILPQEKYIDVGQEETIILSRNRFVIIQNSRQVIVPSGIFRLHFNFFYDENGRSLQCKALSNSFIVL